MASPGPTAAYYEQVLGELLDAVEALDTTAYQRSTGQTWRALRTARVEDPGDLVVWVLLDGQQVRDGHVIREGLSVHVWRAVGRDAALTDQARLGAASAALLGLLCTWGGSQGERLVEVRRDAVEYTDPRAGGDAWALLRYTCTLARMAS